MFSEGEMLALENTANIVTKGEGFLKTRKKQEGRELSAAVGAAYGAGAGFLVGGPVGAAITGPIGGAVGGMLYDGFLHIRSMITGESFD